MSSKYFNNQNSIGDDQCAILARDMQDQEIAQYELYNYYKGNKTGDDCTTYNKKDIQEFAFETHMNIRDGYGVTNECTVDQDNLLRNIKPTHYRGHKQLFQRNFVAVPALNKVYPIFPIEDRLREGDTKVGRISCDRLGERQYDVFTPLQPCIQQDMQNPDRVIMPNWGGIGTRDTLQQADYLEKHGYEFDSKHNYWKKRVCSY